jgi:non-ribosomal peptide synthetase component E (peptide arylation enzyme)
MLDGGMPFPAGFAARYRERGYGEGRPLRDELGYDRSVTDLVFHATAERVLGLSRGWS